MRICAFEHGALTPHSARLGDVGVSLCWHPQVHRLQRGLRTTQRHCITDPPSLSIIASQTVSSVLCSTAPPRAPPHTAHTHIVLDRLIRAQNCAQPQHVECLHRPAPRALPAAFPLPRTQSKHERKRTCSAVRTPLANTWRRLAWHFFARYAGRYPLPSPRSVRTHARPLFSLHSLMRAACCVEPV